MPIFSYAGQVQAKLQLSENRIKIAGILYISTAGVISWAISPKFGEMTDSVSIDWTLLGLSPAVYGFSRYKVYTTRISLVFSVIGHSARIRNRRRVLFKNKYYKIYLNICANFQPCRASTRQATA